MESLEFEKADPDEKVLWQLACSAWMAEVCQSYSPVGRSLDGAVDYFDIDLSKSPSVEISDGAGVRRFSVKRGEVDSVVFELSDPIRLVDPILEPKANVMIFEFDGRRPLTLKDHVPERMLDLVAFLIPRRNREPIVGDIFEDIHDLRMERRREVLIGLVVVWQVSIVLGRGLASGSARFVLRLLMLQKVFTALRHWLVG